MMAYLILGQGVASYFGTRTWDRDRFDGSYITTSYCPLNASLQGHDT